MPMPSFPVIFLREATSHYKILQVHGSILHHNRRPDVGRLQLPQEAPDVRQKWHCAVIFSMKNDWIRMMNLLVR